MPTNINQPKTLNIPAMIDQNPGKDQKETKDHLSLCLIDIMSSEILAISTTESNMSFRKGQLLKDHLQPQSIQMIFNWLFIHHYSSMPEKRLVRIDGVRFTRFHNDFDIHCIVLPFNSPIALLMFYRSLESLDHNEFIASTVKSVQSLIMSNEWQHVRLSDRDLCQVLICMKDNYDQILWSSSDTCEAFKYWIREDQIPLFQQTYHRALFHASSSPDFHRILVVDKQNSARLLHFLAVKDVMIVHLQLIQGQIPHSPFALAGPLRTRQKDEALIAKVNLSQLFQH